MKAVHSILKNTTVGKNNVFFFFKFFFLPKDTDKVCHLYLINIFSVRGLKKKKEEEKNYIASQANPSNYCSSTCSAANGPH